MTTLAHYPSPHHPTCAFMGILQVDFTWPK